MDSLRDEVGNLVDARPDEVDVAFVQLVINEHLTQPLPFTYSPL